jgi:hypothetical protein
VASAAYFAAGDYTSGILYLIGIAAAFFGLGFAVKGLQLLLRALARGGGHITRLLVSGGKLGMAQKAYPMMKKLQAAVLAIMSKLGLSAKYGKGVQGWFVGKRKSLKGAIEGAKKTMAGSAGIKASQKALDKMIRRDPKQLLAAIKENPLVLKTLTPLQRKMFGKNIGKAGRVELKGIAEQAAKRGIGVGGAGTLGLTGLMAADMVMGDDDKETDTKDKGEGSMTGKMWDTLAKPGDDYKGHAPFMEEL